MVSKSYDPYDQLTAAEGRVMKTLHPKLVLNMLPKQKYQTLQQTSDRCSRIPKVL